MAPLLSRDQRLNGIGIPTPLRVEKRAMKDLKKTRADLDGRSLPSSFWIFGGVVLVAGNVTTLFLRRKVR